MPARRLSFTLLYALAFTAAAAPLADTPEVLLEKAERLRNARDLPWDPATGRLGNLRHVQIVAPDCTVRVISGLENRVYAGRGSVRIADSPRVRDRQPGRGPTARDLTITATSGASGPEIPRIGDASGPVCFTLQVATAHSYILGGDRLKVLFDRIELPVVDLYLNPSFGLELWFRDVRLGALRVQSNASAMAGGTGQVERLSLGSSQASTALLFHEMNARHVGVSTTTTGPRFSIAIGPQTEATYHQPARAPGNLALHYPIWIDGPVAALKIPVGRVNPMEITEAIRGEARKLRDDVSRSAGPMPQLPAADPLPPSSRAMPETVSPRQRVAEVLQPFLPAGMTLGGVELWKRGSALVGSAPDESAVRQFVENLKRSGEVRSPQLAGMRRESGRVAYRILVYLMCDSPGEPTLCLPGSGEAYTLQQIEDALKPVLGPRVEITKLRLGEDGMVHLEGRAGAGEARAALDRIRASAPWVQTSFTGVGNGVFRAGLRMVCTVPPRGEGICTPGKRAP